MKIGVIMLPQAKEPPAARERPETALSSRPSEEPALLTP